MRNDEVIEYFLDSENNITGYQLWPKKKKPQFINNPEPKKRMSEPGGFKHEPGGGYRYKLIDNKIVETVDDRPLEQVQALVDLEEMDFKEILRALCVGINDNRNDPRFLYVYGKIMNTGVKNYDPTTGTWR